MANPFIISAKFTLDGSSVTASAGDIRAEFSRLDAVLDTSARKAVELQTALDRRSSSAGAVAAYQSTLQQVRAEQQLESQRLSSQITETGRAQSINRLAQLARDAAAASQALARAEADSAQATQAAGAAASTAAVAVARLADQQQRVAALRAVGINSALGVRDDFGTVGRGEDVVTYGRALNEMRAQYNPLFAAEQRHMANLAGIQRARQIGAISSRESALAVRAEAGAYAQAVASINNNTEALQRNAAMRANGGGQFATANIAAQFQDIAVTSAMGMSPLQIALQQGTQISAAFGNMGAAGAVRTLGAAFLSVVSPVSLVTIGLVAGSAAAIQYFSGLGAGAQDADERLDEHLERIEQIARGYDGAIEAAEDYIERSRREPEGSVASNLEKARTDSLKLVSSALDEISEKNAEIAVDFMSWQSNRMIHADLIRAMEELGDLGVTANSTQAEIGDLHTRLTDLANDPSAPRQAQQYASDLLNLIEQLLNARLEVDSIGASLRALPQDIRIRLSVGAEFETALSDIQSLYIDPRSRFDVARESLDNSFEQATATAQSYGQLVGAAEQYERVLGSINTAEDEAEAKTAARAAKQVSAYERQIQTIQERTAAQQMETNVIGLGTFATERARMVLELENAAREDAIGLSSTRVAQIQEEATAYALAAAAQEEVVKAQRLATEQVEFGRTTFRSFFSDLKAGLNDGQSGWAALGNAGANALDRIADRALGMMSDGIFDFLFNAILGGITGGFGGGMGGGLGGVSSITGSSGGFFPGFAEGGWTGGVAGQTRGLVHGEEFVVRAGPAAQNRQLLEAINSGAGVSMGGGFTYAPVSNFSVPSGSRAEFAAMLDERDRRIFADLPGALADAQRRAVRSAA